MTHRLLLLLISTTLTSCAVQPQHKMRAGEVQPTTAQRVIFLPTVCTSADDECEDEYARGAQGIVQSELEFAGYSIVDAQKLVMQARTREDASAELRLFGERLAGAKSLAQRGSIFEDLPPSAKRELVREAKADGLLSVRINVTSNPDLIMNNTMQVTIRYGIGEDGAKLGWVSQCKIAQKAFSENLSDAEKVEAAAKCAIDKAMAGS